MKFVFTAEHEAPLYSLINSKHRGTKLTMEFEAEDLEVVLSEFQDFLRGLGFHFDGQLEIVNDTDANTIELVRKTFQDDGLSALVARLLWLSQSQTRLYCLSILFGLLAVPSMLGLLGLGNLLACWLTTSCSHLLIPLA